MNGSILPEELLRPHYLLSPVFLWQTNYIEETWYDHSELPKHVDLHLINGYKVLVKSQHIFTTHWACILLVRAAALTDLYCLCASITAAGAVAQVLGNRKVEATDGTGIVYLVAIGFVFGLGHDKLFLAENWLK